MKLCADKECRRSGIALELSEFPRNKTRADGLHSYCKECAIRHVHRYRARLREKKAAEKEARAKFGIVERKPIKIAGPRFALSLVYEAIQKGYRTREEIRWFTKLGFDDIGDALAILAFEAKGIVIKNRKYIPIEEVLAA